MKNRNLPRVYLIFFIHGALHILKNKILFIIDNLCWDFGTYNSILFNNFSYMGLLLLLLLLLLLSAVLGYKLLDLQLQILSVTLNSLFPSGRLVWVIREHRQNGRRCFKILNCYTYEKEVSKKIYA